MLRSATTPTPWPGGLVRDGIGGRLSPSRGLDDGDRARVQVRLLPRAVEMFGLVIHAPADASKEGRHLQARARRGGLEDMAWETEDARQGPALASRGGLRCRTVPPLTRAPRARPNASGSSRGSDLLDPWEPKERSSTEVEERKVGVGRKRGRFQGFDGPGGHRRHSHTTSQRRFSTVGVRCAWARPGSGVACGAGSAMTAPTPCPGSGSSSRHRRFVT